MRTNRSRRVFLLATAEDGESADQQRLKVSDVYNSLVYGNIAHEIYPEYVLHIFDNCCDNCSKTSR